MLHSYFQNASISMTKETYFELCETLGNEPVDEEIPVELDDFPDEVQEAIMVYYKLKDEWDTMNGVYMGKSFAGFNDILDILEVPFQDRKMLLEWVGIMDAARNKVYQEQRAAKEAQSKKK